MTTTITIAGTDVTYRDFSITVPTSPVDIAPSAEVVTTADETISANDTLTIDIDGTTVFSGRTRSGGTISELGGVEVEAYHQARDVFEDTVSLSLTTPTTEEVLSAALSNADGGGALTLSYSGTAETLNNDYNVTDRSVKRIFRDMTDRTGRVWWVDPGGTTVNVQPLGGRGTWQVLNTQTDGASLQRFDTGNVDTVRNAVTVVGTGEEQVRATATDATSISTYGRRPGNSPYNVSYVTTTSEAQAIADELLITDPQPEGQLLAGRNVGDITQPLANFEVDITDPGKNIDVDNLVIESQTIEQGRATLALGAGTGVSIEEINRKSKSQDDQNEPGSVYNSDRLADGSVDTNQLVDSAVIEQKLDDLSVSTAKLQNNAVINGKLDDLSVSETKIQDDSIATPKLQAEAVTAAKILADTITANEIAAGTITATEILADTITANEIAAGTITALEIATDTLTANQIDTLDLDATEISVGADADNQIVFETFEIAPGVTVTRMVPSADELSTLGAPNNRFDDIHTKELTADSVSARGSISGFQDSGAANGIQFEEFIGDTSLVPDNDVTCTLGTGDGTTATDAFFEIHTHNFYEYSPAPVSSDASPGPNRIDTRELLNATWDGPPAYVRQRKVVTDRDEEGNPTAFDHEPLGGPGVELGAMANYLLEVCKHQQQALELLEQELAAERAEREQQAERIDALEERLSSLEKQV